jgi:hypothetical protein
LSRGSSGRRSASRSSPKVPQVYRRTPYRSLCSRRRGPGRRRARSGAGQVWRPW